MDVIISENNLSQHSISKYSFKVLGSGDTEHAIAKEDNSLNTQVANSEKEVVSSSPETVPVQQPKDEIVQSLLKKTDELSGNYIKLQMKLEARDEEHKSELEKVKESAYAKGVEAGRAQMSEELDEKIKDNIAQFAKSIETIGKTAKDLELALDPLRDELVSVAIDIAKEVVVSELSNASADVATALASKLLEEVKGSTSVKLRINPKDYEHVKEHIGDIKGLEIEPDSALTAGGVVVISDVGNIDGDVMKRFERVKAAALSSE